METGNRIRFIKTHYIQESYLYELPDEEKINILGREGIVVEILGDSFIIDFEDGNLPMLFLNSCKDKIERL